MPITASQMTDITTIEVNGVKFHAKRMKPMKVIHIGRRLAPVLMAFQGLQAEAAPIDVDPGDPVEGGPVPGKAAGAVPDTPAANTMERFLPLAEAVAGLSDADSEYVIGACLAVTKREGHAWSSLWDPAHSQVTDDSLTPGEIMAVVGQVLSKIFNDLMDDLPSLGVPGFAGG